MYSNKLENYLELLKIRRKGKRRDTIIIGAVFWILFGLFIAFGMLGKFSDTPYVEAAMLVSFGIGYLTIWVRLEIIKGNIELIDNILLMYE